MGLTEYKITDAEIARKGIAAAPDTLRGSATENKRVFDRLIRESIKALFNGLIDSLSGEEGASEIGVRTVAGAAGGTVQAVLESLKTLVDAKLPRAEGEAALAQKSDRSATDRHFKDAAFDSGMNRMNFTREDGTTKAVYITPSRNINIYDGDTGVTYKLAAGSGRLMLEEV